jgi:hypothetical protein
MGRENGAPTSTKASMRHCLLAFTLAATSCWADDAQLATVELDIFSGEPNPTWQSTPEETREIQRNLVGLVPVRVDPPPPRLGYRGFTVTLEGTDGGHAYEVGSGLIVARSIQPAAFRDEGLEAALLVHAHRRGLTPPAGK